MSQLVLEGTWEDIAEHATELAGKRVRVFVLESPPAQNGLPASLAEIEERPLAEALQGIIGAIDSTEDSPDRHPSTPFTEILAEKFRKQGLRIP